MDATALTPTAPAPTSVPIPASVCTNSAARSPLESVVELPPPLPRVPPLVGVTVGNADGIALGSGDGALGWAVGSAVGAVGAAVGIGEGPVGARVGPGEGVVLGWGVGPALLGAGVIVGCAVGCTVGD